MIHPSSVDRAVILGQNLDINMLEQDVHTVAFSVWSGAGVSCSDQGAER